MPKRAVAVLETEPSTEPPVEEPQTEPISPEPLSGSALVASVLSLQAQINTQRDAAIQHLLQEQQTISEQLISLGYNQPEPEGISPVKPPAKRGGKAIRPDAYCKICQIKGHDGRLHRGQGDKPRKFTPQELSALASR